jgi:quercetin dioxygenase-like cupin family protein
MKVVTLALSAGVLAAAVAAGAEDAGKAVVWPAGKIQWSDSKAIAGAKRAVLWGDQTREAYAAIIRVPAGTVLPAHTHSFDHRVVMVSGTIQLSVGGATSDLGPGSYALLPARLPHSATCAAGAECTYFEESSGKDDMILVEAAKK